MRRLALSALVTSGVVSTVFSAQCNTFTTQNTCDGVAGCFWTDGRCACASTVTMDVVYALDSSGSIGEDDFQIELDWVVQMLESAMAQDARTAFVRFASRTSDLLSLEESDSMTIPERQSFVEEISYTGGWTDTTGALDSAINTFDEESNDQISKLLIMITDGNPNAPDGDNDVCSRSDDLESRQINVLIIGVGDEWDPENLRCLVNDDSDILKAADYSQSSLDAIMPAITDVTCPVEYDLMLSEVHLEQTSDGRGSRFVEIWNRGGSVTLRDVRLEGIFEGKISDDDGQLHLNQSQYLVLYDKQSDLPSCEDCQCELSNMNHHQWCESSLYIACCDDSSECPCQFAGSEMDNKHWNMTFVDSTTNGDIDYVIYENGSWPIIFKGYSYTLKNLTSDHTNGTNWRQSCNTRGTPGSGPISECEWTCTDDECQSNGDSSAQCSRDGDECDCDNSAHYFFGGGTCQIVPKTGLCKAHWLYNVTDGRKLVEFIWEQPMTDLEVNYTLTYPTNRGRNDRVFTEFRSKRVFDFGKYDDFDAVAGYVQTNIDGVHSERTECRSESQSPTMRPTRDPTSTPTMNPTLSPTANPTYSKPRVYISGDLCENERCECYEKDWDCEGTEEIYKDYAASDDDQFVSVKRWPRDYPFIVRIGWHIELINSRFGGRNESNENDENHDDEGGSNNIDNRRRMIEKLMSKDDTLLLDRLFEGSKDPSMKRVSEEDMRSMLVQRGLLSEDEDEDGGLLSTSSSSTMAPTDYGIHPRRGRLVFNGSLNEFERIAFQIERKRRVHSEDEDEDDEGSEDEGRYRLFRLSLDNCEIDEEHSNDENCDVVYPRSFFLVVDTTGDTSTENLTTTSEKTKVFPWWIWWVILALLVFLLILSAMVYRYWAKNEETKSQLQQTEQELDRAFEDNELGFGHDLGPADITFNPIATGTPAAVPAPPVQNQFILDQQESVHLDKADVIAEKFDVKAQFGGVQPSRKPQIGTDPLLG